MTNVPTAAYITINNIGSQDDKLISIQSDISDKVEIHETKLDAKGVMTMIPVTTGLLLKANTKTELKPRSAHIMIHNITEPVFKHGHIPLKLNFEKSGTRMVNFIVDDIENHQQCSKEHCKKCGDKHAKGEQCHHGKSDKK
jgi:hypothetical protein